MKGRAISYDSNLPFSETTCSMLNGKIKRVAFFSGRAVTILSGAASVIAKVHNNRICRTIVLSKIIGINVKDGLFVHVPWQRDAEL